MNDKSKKKKIIVGSLTAFVILVGALAIVIFNNIKNELQEVARLEQEEKKKEAQELKEQQKQEEKERQEKLAKYETEWSLLEDGKQYLALSSDYLKRVEKHENGLYSYKISEEFVGTLYSIVDGFYNGATMEDLGVILNGALASLPDNATGKEVYDALVDYADTVDRDEVVTGEGTNPMDVLTPSTNQSNGNSNTNNNSDNNSSTTNSNKNNNSNGNTSSNNNPPADTSDEDYSVEDTLPDGWASNQVEGDPDDHKAGVGGGLGTGGN